MTAIELIQSQLDESGYQFNACLTGVSEENFDAKPVPVSMSLREMVGHCMEALQAVITGAAGGNHEWGTFSAPELPSAELISAYAALREEAIAAGMSVFESKPDFLSGYIVFHEVYHVGQMVTIRLALGDGWEPYSIYRH